MEKVKVRTQLCQGRDAPLLVVVVADGGDAVADDPAIEGRSWRWLVEKTFIYSSPTFHGQTITTGLYFKDIAIVIDT